MHKKTLLLVFSLLMLDACTGDMSGTEVPPPPPPIN